MGGTLEGGRKAAATNKLKHGTDFYREIGRKGGRISRGGGFAVMSHEELVRLGQKGGSRSKRGKSIPTETKQEIYDAYSTETCTMAEIAKRYGVSAATVRRIVAELAPF